MFVILALVRIFFMLFIRSFHPILILVWLVINMAINYLSKLPSEYQMSSINSGVVFSKCLLERPLCHQDSTTPALFLELSSMCQSLLRLAFLLVAKMNAAVLIHIDKHMRPSEREGLSSSNYQANMLCFTDVRPP